MYSTSTQASHTTSSGLTDRKNTFVGHPSRQSDFGERGIVRPSATSCKTLLLAVVMRAIHWVHVPILRIKKTSADFGYTKKSLDSDSFCLFFVQNKSLLTKTRSNWNLNFIISIKRKEPDFNIVSLGLSLDVLIYMIRYNKPESKACWFNP